jgi:hypothetical protein
VDKEHSDASTEAEPVDALRLSTLRTIFRYPAPEKTNTIREKSWLFANAYSTLRKTRSRD